MFALFQRVDDLFEPLQGLLETGLLGRRIVSWFVGHSQRLPRGRRFVY